MIVILGPTASGKTHLATHLATLIGGEIVSADSRQVYRGMTIGTGKDLDEYILDGRPIPYHLIDILDAGEKYNVYQFQQDALKVISEIRQRNRIPILCGGSGLYIQALLCNHQFTGVPVDFALRDALADVPHEQLVGVLRQFNTDYTNIADTSTHKRTIRAIEIARFLSTNPDFEFPDYELTDFRVFGLCPPVAIRRLRISQRLHQRLQTGLLEEVQELLNQGILPENLIYYGLEYKFVTEHLTGLMTYENMVSRLETEIHRFAKRQMTYFRKMERDGIPIHWLEHHLSLEQWIDTITSKLN